MPATSTTARTAAILGIAVATLTACDSATSNNSNASLRFASPAVAGASVATAQGLSITGTNGTLVITDMRLVVDELELERVDVASCDDDVEPEPAGCEEFEARLFPVDVPLGSGSVTIANDRITPGTYDQLEFEVKDLTVDPNDPDDAARAARIAEVLAQLRQTYADWPASASIVVTGTFTPTGGVAVPFRVYLAAEVEVEQTFATPLVIDAGTAGITIDLRPDLWFRNQDGTVRNLSLDNYATTQTVLDFEAEFESGVEIEIDG